MVLEQDMGDEMRMDALDGLQAIGHKVGMISLVQEMTVRIDVKILVQKASEGRSQLLIAKGWQVESGSVLNCQDYSSMSSNMLRPTGKLISGASSVSSSS
jgi:hypothetical protein